MSKSKFMRVCSLIAIAMMVAFGGFFVAKEQGPPGPGFTKSHEQLHTDFTATTAVKAGLLAALGCGLAAGAVYQSRKLGARLRRSSVLLVRCKAFFRGLGSLTAYASRRVLLMSHVTTSRT